jgi:hypothetical protein
MVENWENERRGGPEPAITCAVTGAHAALFSATSAFGSAIFSEELFGEVSGMSGTGRLLNPADRRTPWIN